MGVMLGVGGCIEGPGPDSNPQVFQTVGETDAARRAQQSRTWKESAVAIVQEMRPNVRVTAAEDFAIVLQGSGVRHEIDLSPVRESLTARGDESEAILRGYLARQLPGFDQEWLAGEPYEKMRGHIRAWPISGGELSSLSEQCGGEALLHATLVAGDLYWLPVVRLENLSGPIPVGSRVLRAWGVEAGEIDRIAMANLQEGLAGAVFETTRFGPAGNVGRLKAADPGIVLLPGFLEKVRQAWGGEGDLALLLTSPGTIQFVESDNKQLLDMLYPQWQEMVEETAQPLSRKPLLLTKEGVRPMEYTPPVALRRLTTRPATMPVRNPKGPSTKPTTKPYLVF